VSNVQNFESYVNVYKTFGLYAAETSKPNQSKLNSCYKSYSYKTDMEKKYLNI